MTVEHRFQAMIRDPEAYSDMDYLLTEAAQARCVIAAHFLRNCPHVIEIGGFKTPITLFLTGKHRSVTVIDPLMREFQSENLNGRACKVRHIPQTFQSAEIEVPGEYGFLMLGASLKYFDRDTARSESEWSRLAGLIQGARVAVIEAAVDWPLGLGILERILQLPDIRVRATLDLDLSRNPGMDPEHFRRRLVVLESARAIPPGRRPAPASGSGKRVSGYDV